MAASESCDRCMSVVKDKVGEVGGTNGPRTQHDQATLQPPPISEIPRHRSHPTSSLSPALTNTYAYISVPTHLHPRAPAHLRPRPPTQQQPSDAFDAAKHETSRPPPDPLKAEYPASKFNPAHTPKGTAALTLSRQVFFAFHRPHHVPGRSQEPDWGVPSDLLLYGQSGAPRRSGYLASEL